MVREGVKRLLGDEPDIAVVGEAADGRGGLWQLARLCAEGAPGGPVDVVVTDLGLPDIGGLEVARQAKALRPETRVLLLTMHQDSEYIEGLLASGADGYLLKQGPAEELAPAIRTVARGETALSPHIASLMLKHLRLRRERERYPTLLSDRERQILNLLAEGSTSKEVAQRLGLSAKTVENHRARILEKLGASNTAAAIGLAAQAGLLTAQPA